MEIWSSKIRFYFLFVGMCAHVGVHVCHVIVSAYRDQKGLDFLEMELSEVSAQNQTLVLHNCLYP